MLPQAGLSLPDLGQRLTSSFATKLILVAFDVLALLLLFSLVYWIRVGGALAFGAIEVWGIVLITVLTFYTMDVYRTEAPLTGARLPLQTFLATPLAAVLATFFVYTIGVDSFKPVFGRGVLPVVFLLFAFFAAYARWCVTYCQQRFAPYKSWLFISDASAYQQFSTAFKVNKDHQQLLYLSNTADAGELGKIEAALPAQSELGIIIDTDKELAPSLEQAVLQRRLQGTELHTLSAFYELYWSRVPVLHLRVSWFIQSKGFRLINDAVGLRFQRLLDLIAAFSGLLLLLPVLCVIGIIVSLDSTGGVLFRQTRVGLHGKNFTLYKFRSMVANAEKDGAQWAQKNDMRVTKVGRFLRLSRLDELPQLYNILKGEMSLIGPRPERPEFVEQLEQQIPYYDLRHTVRPGVTGWAQVMYEYGASVDDARRKLEYDLFYIKNHSIQLDFAILLKTAVLMFKRAGR